MDIKAKESAQIKKYRKKIKSEILEQNKKITPAALKRMSSSIKEWITLHRLGQASLKKKSIVFDENAHSEKSHNQFVIRLLTHLKNESRKEKKQLKTLSNRISHIS